MGPSDLQRHFTSTYFSLRFGLGILAILFPVLLVVVGSLRDIPLQNSMSAYYFAEPTDPAMREFRMRGLFVGILFAVGFFLFLYKGFSRTENIALNLAGLCAVLVALIPMKTACEDCGTNDFAFWHYFFAALLFACIAFVAVLCSEKTLNILEEVRGKEKADKYRNYYDIIGASMILLPSLAFVLSYVFEIRNKAIILVEALGIVVFSIYWFVKSRELRISNAEKIAIKGEMQTRSTAPAKDGSWRSKSYPYRMAIFERTERSNQKIAATARATGTAVYHKGAAVLAAIPRPTLRKVGRAGQRRCRSWGGRN